jgi:arsenate reductase
MSEIGIDISKHMSKALDQYLDQRFDEVITVCDDANDACPVFPGAVRRRHWSVPDPSIVMGSSEDDMHAFRVARDDLRHRIERELLAN